MKIAIILHIHGSLENELDKFPFILSKAHIKIIKFCSNLAQVEIKPKFGPELGLEAK